VYTEETTRPEEVTYEPGISQGHETLFELGKGKRAFTIRRSQSEPGLLRPFPHLWEGFALPIHEKPAHAGDSEIPAKKGGSLGKLFLPRETEDGPFQSVLLQGRLEAFLGEDENGLVLI